MLGLSKMLWNLQKKYISYQKKKFSLTFGDEKWAIYTIFLVFCCIFDNNFSGTFGRAHLTLQSFNKAI